MIPIYIISLRSETLRRQHMMAQMASYCPHALFVDAVDMRSATSQKIQSLSQIPCHKKAKKQRWLSAGELGCALSHHQVYQRMITAQQPYALILEDDALWIQDPTPLLLPENLNLIQKQYPFDILIIGYVKTLPQQLPYYYRRIPLKKRATLPHPPSHSALHGRNMAAERLHTSSRNKARQNCYHSRKNPVYLRTIGILLNNCAD